MWCSHLQRNGPKFYSWLRFNVLLYNDFHPLCFLHNRSNKENKMFFNDKKCWGVNKEIIIIINENVDKEEFFCFTSLLHQHTNSLRLCLLANARDSITPFQIFPPAPRLTFFTALCSSKHVAFVEFDLILNLTKCCSKTPSESSPLSTLVQPHTYVLSKRNIKTFTLQVIA